MALSGEKARGGKSAVEATQDALSAVEEWNPSTKAMLTVTPDAALEAASEVDERAVRVTRRPRQQQHLAALAPRCAGHQVLEALLVLGPPATRGDIVDTLVIGVLLLDDGGEQEGGADEFGYQIPARVPHGGGGYRRQHHETCNSR